MESELFDETPDEILFHLYLRVRAKIEAEPDERARWIADSIFDTASFDDVDATWRARIDRDPVIGRAFANVWPSYREDAHQEARDKAPPQPAPPPPTTAPRSEVPLDEPPIAPFVVEPPRVEGGRLKLDRTALSFEAPLGDKPLPFTVKEDRPFGGTALALDIPQSAVLPFAQSLSGDKPSPAAPPNPSPAPAPKATDAPAARMPFSGTSLALDIPNLPATPFEQKPEPPKKLDALGSTSLALDIPLGLVLPFAQGPSGDKPPPPAPPPPAPAPAKPALTLEQHASLSAELAMLQQTKGEDRAAEAAILARYGLTAESKGALDATIRTEIEADPARRAAWYETYRRYAAWLAAQRR